VADSIIRDPIKRRALYHKSVNNICNVSLSLVATFVKINILHDFFGIKVALLFLKILNPRAKKLD
jgi:hypothetical protein